MSKLSKLETQTKVLQNINGHDKFVRVVQYSVRIIRHLTTELESQNKETPTKFTFINYDSVLKTLNTTAKTQSVTRRACRLFKQIQVIKGIFTLFQKYKDRRQFYKNCSSQEKKDKIYEKDFNRLYLSLKIVNLACATIFFTLDSVFWLYLIGVYKDRPTMGKIQDFIDWVWMVQCTAVVGYDTIEMNLSRKKLNQKNLSSEEKEKIKDRIGECGLDIVKSISDGFCAIGFQDNKNFSDGMIGGMGIIAGLVGIYQQSTVVR